MASGRVPDLVCGAAVEAAGVADDERRWGGSGGAGGGLV